MRIVEILFYGHNKVKLVVEMPDPDRCTTDCAPHVPTNLFRLFPRLACHKCHNEHGYPFTKEAMATEVPHLLEHLIIELQAQTQREGILKGETQWNWRVDPRGTFHVHLDYHNQLLVLASIRLAERIVNLLDRNEIELLDLPAEMKRLRAVAQLGEELPAVPVQYEFPATPAPRANGRGKRRSKALLPEPALLLAAAQPNTGNCVTGSTTNSDQPAGSPSSS